MVVSVGWVWCPAVAGPGSRDESAGDDDRSGEGDERLERVPQRVNDRCWNGGHEGSGVTHEIFTHPSSTDLVLVAPSTRRDHHLSARTLSHARWTVGRHPGEAHSRTRGHSTGPAAGSRRRRLTESLAAAGAGVTAPRFFALLPIDTSSGAP